eukprot:3987751-Pleurochrysis_carterae.AAC.2
MPTALVAPKLKSKKRKTDNRQSKGRKLSYEVQPQLQNFMFPVIPERPVVLSELFSSVFGTSTSAAPPKAAKRGKSTNQATHGTVDYDEDAVSYSTLWTGVLLVMLYARQLRPYHSQRLLVRGAHDLDWSNSKIERGQQLPAACA